MKNVKCLPKLLFKRSKVVHVAANWYVHAIFVLSVFRSAELYKFSSILDSEVSPANNKFHYYTYFKIEII